MIDAYCDMKFVWEGIKFKYGMIKYDYTNENNIKLLKENTEAYSAIEVTIMLMKLKYMTV